MPIMNTVIAGGGSPAPAQVPDYYPKLTVNQNGELEKDLSQTTFSTAPATDIATTELFMDAFTDLSGLGNHYRIQTINLDSLTDVTAESAFMSAFMGLGTVTSFSAAGLTTINGSNVFNTGFCDVDNGASNNYVSTFSFPALTEIYGAYVFQEAWARNMRVVSLSFPLLELISVEDFIAACTGSPLVASASFPSLTFVDSGAFNRAFSDISPSTYDFPTHTLTLTFGGTDPIDFNGNVDCFEDMLDGTDIDVTINAPLASQSDFEQMTGYPDFGCTGTVTWNWQS